MQRNRATGREALAQPLQTHTNPLCLPSIQTHTGPPHPLVRSDAYRPASSPFDPPSLILRCCRGCALSAAKGGGGAWPRGINIKEGGCKGDISQLRNELREHNNYTVVAHSWYLSAERWGQRTMWALRPLNQQAIRRIPHTPINTGRSTIPIWCDVTCFVKVVVCCTFCIALYHII